MLNDFQLFQSYISHVTTFEIEIKLGLFQPLKEF